MRAVLAAMFAVFALSALAADDGRSVYADVLPGRTFSFPADHGAHLGFRTEWWYVTGFLDTADGKTLGFQVTFFRTKPDVDSRNPSAFAPKQILFAHAALSDPSLKSLRHDGRIARTGFGLASVSENDTDIVLDDWSIQRNSDGRFRTKIAAKDFAFDFAFEIGRAHV